MNARLRLVTPGIALLLAAGPAVAADALPRAESLAAAKKTLVSAKQDPALAGLSHKALLIATDLERISAELDRLRSLKVGKTDPVFKGLITALEADRVRLLALQAQAQPVDGSGQTKQSSGETKQSAEESQKSRDRRKAAMDSIQKLLDIIRGMNPQL
jgi:hypothetical protein